MFVIDVVFRSKKNQRSFDADLWVSADDGDADMMTAIMIEVLYEDCDYGYSPLLEDCDQISVLLLIKIRAFCEDCDHYCSLIQVENLCFYEDCNHDRSPNKD